MPALAELTGLLYGTSGLAAEGGLSNFAKADYWEAVSNDFNHTFNSNRIDFALHGGYLGLWYHQYFGEDKKPSGSGEAIPSPPIVVEPAVAKKMYDELTELYKKTLNNPGMVYALKANADGWYNVYSAGNLLPTGSRYLKKGEIWKYGETTSGERYSNAYLAKEKVYLAPIATGSQLKIKAMEKLLIYGYFFQHGKLPAGNKIFR